MKIFTGTDITEVSRIKKDIEESNEKFLNKIYTEEEIRYCESKNSQKYESYAARFAAKEAIYKAINSKMTSSYNWKDFEIINDTTGKPNANIKIKIDNLEYVEVSLSHSKEYAIASVLACFKE